jgi:hypothetical protein
VGDRDVRGTSRRHRPKSGNSSATPSRAGPVPLGSRKAWLYTDLAHASITAPNASASPARASARNCGVGSSTLVNWLGRPSGSCDPRHIPGAEVYEVT